MKIYRFITTKEESEIPNPSFFKFDYDYELGETEYFIKVEEGIKTTVMIKTDIKGVFVSIDKEEWDGHESEVFKWKDSTEDEFKEKKLFAINNI